MTNQYIMININSTLLQQFITEFERLKCVNLNSQYKGQGLLHFHSNEKDEKVHFGTIKFRRI